MTDRSPSDVLGVEPDADEADVKRAYRRRAMETHPDQGGSERAFRRVQEAYEQLTVNRRGGGGDGDAAASGDVERRERAESRVEYLDYEVLDDFGWDLDDPDLFEKAADADLDEEAHGEFAVDPDESLLQAAEDAGHTWPYACRGGACANCAVAVTAGEVSTPVDHVLPPELTDRGIRLACVGTPVTAEARIVYNVKHLPDLDDLRLPPYPFEVARDGA